jgi:hypothetical protein
MRRVVRINMPELDMAKLRVCSPSIWIPPPAACQQPPKTTSGLQQQDPVPPLLIMERAVGVDLSTLLQLARIWHGGQQRPLKPYLTCTDAILCA